MAKDGSIRTEFDDLIVNLKLAGGKPVSVWELSSKTGMSQSHVIEWLSVLEKNSQVKVQYRLGGTFAAWTGSLSVSTMQGPTEEENRAAREIQASYDAQIESAREREEKAKSQKTETPEEARERHKRELAAMSQEFESVSEQLGRVDGMLSKFKEKKKEAHLAELAHEREQSALPEAEEKARAVRKAAQEKQRLANLEAEARWQSEAIRKEEKARKEKEKREAENEALRKKKEQEELERQEEEKASRLLEQVEKEIQAIKPGEEEEIHTEHTFDYTEEPEEKEGIGLEESEQEQITIKESATPVKASMPQPKGRQGASKIKKPKAMEVTGVSLQFSEKLSRQVKKIIGQAQELEKLRMEKEKILTDHYMPMQRRLESEVESISDRVIRMEKNILALHQRASDLPGKVTGVEKLHLSSLKAHNDMQKAYDEASALIEESVRELSDERQKMEELVEQSRHEISSHRAKSEDLEKALKHISQLEEESSNLVISARAALAEQAERLGAAEKYSQELGSLKAEIRDSIDSIKREVSATKGVLTGIEKQMSQMRQIEIWADSIKEDYASKMAEVGDYIRSGNEEFETLRESVEANFVRRYLRELRQLTDSYSFEFGQAKNMEMNLDQRMAEEKKRMEELLEEGRKISYLYETQSREVAGADKFESRAESFKSLSELSGQRRMLQQMISQVTGEKPRVEEGAVPSQEKTGKRISVKIFGSAPKQVKRMKARKKIKKIRKGKKR